MNAGQDPAPAAACAGQEWFKASCTADGCERRWEAHGTLASRKAHARAQKHSDRTGHRIAAEWANRR